MHFKILSLLLLICILPALASDREFFENRIRPVLAEACYKCHAADSKKIRGGLLLDSKWGWQQGGESGQVIIPGKPQESLLVKMIHHDPEVEAMPPKSKLKPRQIADIEEWIRRGAFDPRPKKEAVNKEDHYDIGERKKWWSLQALTTPEIPSVKNDKWPRQELDNFILARLEEKNWQPATAAAQHTWLRRLAYDLTGLPPTPDEIERFSTENDSTGQKAVDHYLASPHFGEHWARKWMDLVRYADTKAFEDDYTMPYAWRYRDYLIRLFNKDVPYNRFILESLAGDLIEPRIDKESGDDEALKGPGYLYLNPGHHGPPDIHEDEARVFDDMINVIGKTFQATTISCARCHDHKFDAVGTRNFYSLYGILSSSRFAYRNAVSPKLLEEKEEQLQFLKKQIRNNVAVQWKTQSGQLSTDLNAIRHGSDLNPRQKKLAALLHKHNKADKVLYPLFLAANKASFKNWDKLKISDMQRDRDKHSSSLGGLSRFNTGQWGATGDFSPRPPADFIIAPKGEKIIKNFCGDAIASGSLSSRFGGSLKSPDFTLSGEDVRVRVKGKNASVNLIVHNYELVGSGVTTGKLRVTVNSDDWQWIRFRTNLWPGARAYIDIRQNGQANQHLPKSQFHYKHDDNAWVAVDQAFNGGKTVLSSHAALAWNSFNDISSPEQAATVIGWQVNQMLGEWQQNSLKDGRVISALADGGYFTATASDPVVAALVKQYRTLQNSVPEPRYVRSLVDGAGRDQNVFVRGLHTNISNKPNPRHFMDGIDDKAFNCKGSGRLEWARKVIDPANPLTARVAVNRLWHHIFGRGLVKTVDDFGQMGEKPTHPELLDYLAQDFMKNDWSVKKMLRKLVLSNTYRMSSQANTASLETDPENKLLQHFTVRRKTAEAIRDSLLQASGRLDRKLFGPDIPVNLRETHSSRARPKINGPLDGKGRRSIYIELRRNYLPGFLTAFDMPNASEPFGRRHSTNVPAQSLALMNDSLVTSLAELWARNIQQNSDPFEKRLDNIHRRAFARAATASERQWSRSVFDKLKNDHGLKENSLEAWQHYCHLIFNRKEFIYIF